jgi:hypothetical protein
MALGHAPAVAVAVVPSSPREADARRWQAAIGATDFRPEDLSITLLAELLGATLVDAHEELTAALAALRKRDPAAMSSLEAWLLEAPPWPPASIQELRRSDPDGALLDALAEQVAPGLEARYWLLQSWEQPGRPLDGAVLGEIARAADGRLARDERFRAWLRADWVAWSRQRYRRVARRAAEIVTSAGSRS